MDLTVRDQAPTRYDRETVPTQSEPATATTHPPTHHARPDHDGSGGQSTRDDLAPLWMTPPDSGSNNSSIDSQLLGTAATDNSQSDSQADPALSDAPSSDNTQTSDAQPSAGPRPAVSQSGITIIDLHPGQGPAQGGIPVTIVGAYFPERAMVSFGGASVFVVGRSPSRLTVIAPAGTPGTWADVTVSNYSRQSVTMTEAFHYQERGAGHGR